MGFSASVITTKDGPGKQTCICRKAFFGSEISALEISVVAYKSEDLNEPVGVTAL